METMASVFPSLLSSLHVFPLSIPARPRTRLRRFRICNSWAGRSRSGSMPIIRRSWALSGSDRLSVRRTSRAGCGSGMFGGWDACVASCGLRGGFGRGPPSSLSAWVRSSCTCGSSVGRVGILCPARSASIPPEVVERSCKCVAGKTSCPSGRGPGRYASTFMTTWAASH